MTTRTLTESADNRHRFLLNGRPGCRALLQGACMSLLMAGGWHAGLSSASPAMADTDAATAFARAENSPVWITIGEQRFAITLADNATARAFAAQLPLTLDMKELNGNEKHARLPQRLPTDASRPGTLRAGDLMLYGSNTLVVFYSTFSSIYSYTRIGHVDEPAALAQTLGRGGVRVIFSDEPVAD